MKDTKVLQAFKTLNAKELKRFEKFARSPYFNQNKNIVTAIAYLSSFYPDLEQDGLSKKGLFLHVYKGGDYDDLLVRHLLSDVLKLLERFLAHENFEKDKVSISLRLLEEFRERELEKHYHAESRKVNRLTLESGLVNDTHYYQRFLLEGDFNEFVASNKSRNIRPNFDGAINSLDTFYLVNKLRYYCMILNYKNILESNYQTLLMDEIIQLVKSADYEDVPAIKIYFAILQMLEDSDHERHFESLTALLEKHVSGFPRKESRNLYQFAQNYCIRQINSGNRNYLARLFNIYKSLLHEEIVFDMNGHLSPFTFKNIVVVGSNLKEFVWVEEFIHGYKEHIREDQRDNAVQFNLSLLYFYKQDYRNALRILSRVVFDDPFYNTDAKSMLLKIYFEQSETEALLSLCESFSVYLKRNKILAETHKRNYLNLIRFVKKLAKIGPDHSERLAKVKAELAETQRVNDRRWLMEQIKHLEENVIDNY